MSEKLERKNSRINWSSLLLLVMLTMPTGLMLLVLYFWPNILWVAEIPHTAIEIISSFAALLLSVFIIARYREQSGIMYVSAGLMAMGIIEGFHAITMPRSDEFIWLQSLASICAGIFFIIYLFAGKENSPIPSIEPSAKGVGWLLGGTATVSFSLGVLSIVFADILPLTMQEDQFTTMAWVIKAVPMGLFLFAGAGLFRQYRKTGARELFLLTTMLIFLFQASEAFCFATTWSLVWWHWQALRLVVYFAVLGYVLREYIQTSESLAVEIVERRKVEESLIKADEDWRDSFNSLEEAMLIIDKDFNIEKINDSGLELFGKNRGEVIGRKCYQVVHGDDEPSSYCPFKKTLENKKVATVERYDELFGKHFSITSAPILDENGQVLKCIYLMRDITEAVRAKEKEKELERELNLTSRLASIGEVAAGIAHEINNPLTGVIGFAQMLSQMDVPESIKEAVEVINEGANRTAGIVEKLLTFARRNKPGKEYVDINSILTSTVDIRSYEMRTNNTEVITELAPDLPRTMANAGQLQQVFLNIIINAEQAMTEVHKGGKISVRTERVNSNILVSISDNGPGISGDNLSKIFDPFFTTKGEDGGTGLGLSISYGIIKEHGGKIHASSKAGKGTTFIIELPILSEVEKVETVELAEEEAVKVNGAKIMVVDDEPNICRVLHRLLSREGHRVETVSDAEDALKRLNKTSYDLILLDIKMPGMSGIEFYNHMKVIDPSLQQKVVCITGDVISSKNKTFLDKAGIPCIVKPFSIDELMRQVKSGLGGQGNNAQTTYSYRR
jgi:PAS domain S-box-containing protein